MRIVGGEAINRSIRNYLAGHGGRPGPRAFKRNNCSISLLGHVRTGLIRVSASPGTRTLPSSAGSAGALVFVGLADQTELIHTEVKRRLVGDPATPG
jgi:hypothetical protein